MAVHAETNASAFDTVKLTFAIVILIAGIVGFYYFAAQALLYRVLGILAISGVSLGLIFTTALGGRIFGFITDARLEVRKVIWPSRQETLQSTMIVVALVVLVGVVLWLLDMFLFWGVGVLTGQKV
ncbi:preprotein translocase subunit SecE [Methylococcus sp. EFPC2]|uniref:preprotein translocase subunit SecE n=1 Tax=Methylococcus sp. EFPC2 TaxID=2812648 RepID=UPI00196747DE|nr:preprotein translocase subunit SecE [Methylococcus sp. EFPC2]QSA96352.1 preprotein translocase subunit SecE [Methylococcus sp. EFPC2]